MEQQRVQPASWRLSEFIRDRKSEILKEWEGAAHALPSARDLDAPALIDHMPELLEAIASNAEEPTTGNQRRLSPELAEAHALERLDEGFDLAQVTSELFLLRDCVLRVGAAELQGGSLASAGLRALHEAIDEAVHASIERHTQAITARARAEEALRRSEERVKRALSIQTVGVLFFSLSGRMLDANGALERMCGYTRAELRGMSWRALTPPEFEATTERTAQLLATLGEAPPYEKQWIRPDGSRWWGLFAPTRLSGGGRQSQCAEFIIDISEHKRAEEALRAAIRAREEILAVVSHDLRNPLGAIQMAAADLARKLASDQRVSKQVGTIRRAASRMDHLIGDLLDMSRIQVGRLAVERTSEDPGALVLEVIQTHEPAAKEKGISIAGACDFRARRLSCDRDRILQVFGNLLGNAIKFCRAGDAITIHGEISGSGAEARFAVSDTGPGIPDEELPHLFEPYWSAARHAKKGTGLGLYISMGIVEAHGGRLWAESKPGSGATFFFTLPLGEAAAALQSTESIAAMGHVPAR